MKLFAKVRFVACGPLLAASVAGVFMGHNMPIIGVLLLLGAVHEQWRQLDIV